MRTNVSDLLPGDEFMMTRSIFVDYVVPSRSLVIARHENGFLTVLTTTSDRSWISKVTVLPGRTVETI